MLIRFSNTQVLLAAPAADPPGGRAEQASGDPGNGGARPSVPGQLCVYLFLQGFEAISRPRPIEDRKRSPARGRNVFSVIKGERVL